MIVMGLLGGTGLIGSTAVLVTIYTRGESR